MDNKFNNYNNPPRVATVYKCNKLNLRKGPTFMSEVVGVYDAKTEVIIISMRGDSDFAEVRTPDGKTGYMCKKYLLRSNF